MGQFWPFNHLNTFSFNSVMASIFIGFDNRLMTLNEHKSAEEKERELDVWNPMSKS